MIARNINWKTTNILVILIKREQIDISNNSSCNKIKGVQICNKFEK